MAQVDAAKAGRPYSRRTKGKRDSGGTPKVMKLETLATRAQALIDLCIKSRQSARDYSDAVVAVADAAGLNAATVRTYIRARAGANFRETRDRMSQLAFVFENLGELGEYKAPPEPEVMTNDPEPNPVERQADPEESLG